jgi:pyruvate formate lyase activating enzyme
LNGVIFDIQHYAVHDGPGIRTTVFFKGCPLRCAWCHNPESQRPEPEMGYFRERCTLCGTCVAACPQKALYSGEHGIAHRPGPCKACGTCVRSCPQGAREIIGREISAIEVSERAERDRPFYEHSGGGVTISGGEPTLQAPFLLELLDSLKTKGMHTCLETCGYFKAELIPDLVPLVDLFLFDVKHLDPYAHEKFTGVSNEMILSNYTTIAERAGMEKVIPRIPLIPGFNDDMRSVDALIRFLEDVKYAGPVHFMPYNKMARPKYEKIGRGGLYRDMGDISETAVRSLLNRVNASSLQAVYTL